MISRPLDALSGSTQVVGVIGDPVAHSLSPLIHNAGFAELGLDWVCVAFPTLAGLAPAAVLGMTALGIEGLSVTMPHKAAVIEALDIVTETATSLGAVNCISRSTNQLIGHNTDGEGFLAALQAEFEFDPTGRVCAVLGAGGAARSVILALKQAGAAEVLVLNRTPESAEIAAKLAGHLGSVIQADELVRADLVVNATSVGMTGTKAAQGMPCDTAQFQKSCIVADLIYHPTQTQLMLAAQSHGCRATNGLSMLIHQAAIAFEIWTGQAAPVAA
ncbi:MAG: shikimate dehydrogenase, partial [Microthrixaceae bacterium]